MKKLKNRFEASSIIETIVAILIATIVFFLSFNIILNSVSGNKLARQYYYQTIVNNAIVKVQTEKDFIPGIFEYEDFIMIKEMHEVNQFPMLRLVEIELQNKLGENLASSRCYLRYEED